MPQHSERRVSMSRPTRGRFRAVTLVGLAIVSLLLPGPAPQASADELSEAKAQQERLQDKIAAQKTQVAQLNRLQAGLEDDITATRAALRSINADISAVRKQVTTIQASVAIVQREYDALVAELAALDGELDRLRQQQALKRDQLTERLDLLAQHIRAAYDAERTSMLEILLSGGSFTDVLTEVSYLTDIGEQDKRLAEAITRDRETLAALEVSVRSTREQTDRLRLETAAQQRKLDRQLAELKAAQKELRTLERETSRALAKQRAAYAKLAKNEAALKKAIAADAKAQNQLQTKIDDLVRAEQEQGNIPSSYNGTFIWPHAGRITQEFGCTGFPWEPPLGNCANFHRGIDIAAARWTPVRAAGDGVVVFAGPNPYDPYPKAWIVIIAHSSSLRTWYAHVDNERPPTVRAGQSVRKGQVIAYVGSTGRSTGNHTDWRVQLRGEFVNPRLFL
jgi:murein DD-endopeptidase MepM/ murein hydrolase activator NlpD